MQIKLGVALVLSSLLSLAAVGCSKEKPGEPVAFSEASRQLPKRIKPNICAGKADGKRFSVAGYLQWSEGLVEANDPMGGSGRVAFMTLVPNVDADETGEQISFRVPVRGFFGEGVESPKLENATSKRGAVRRETETTGTVSNDQIRLHLASGNVADNKKKVRVSLQVEGNNGDCNYKFLTATEES